MPQVDLETLVSACTGGAAERKIACGTLADAGEKTSGGNGLTVATTSGPEVPPDFPPESFWLSKDAELDWFDRNAFLERKESGKGINSNPPNLNQSSSTTSQRFSVSLKTKASIIGLPKTQKTNYVDSKRRSCKAQNIRLFPPKRTGSLSKSAAEPSSPKVSCMGRVRSKRGRRRSGEPDQKTDEPVLDKKTGIYHRFISMFRPAKGKKRLAEAPKKKVNESTTAEAEELVPSRKSVTVRVRDIPVSTEPVAEPPGLGGLKRFSSGRKSESWSAEEINAAISKAFDSDPTVRS